MKKLSILAVLALSLGLVSVGSAFASTASNDANSEIVTAIAIWCVDPIEFGQFAAGPGPGTVTLSTTGVRTGSGVTLVTGTTPVAANFGVTGDPGSSYTITLPSSPVTLTSGGNTMTIDQFVSDPIGSGTLAGGEDYFTVGATLNVGAAQPAGVYTGTFDIGVDYN